MNENALRSKLVLYFTTLMSVHVTLYASVSSFVKPVRLAQYVADTY